MTGLSFESVRVKSGAFCPTCGAADEGGSHEPATKIMKSNAASMNSPNAAAKELKIFETILLSGLKARRRPRNKSTNAIANRTRVGPRKFTRYRPPHEYKRVAKSRNQAHDKSCPNLPIQSLHEFIPITESIGMRKPLPATRPFYEAKPVGISYRFYQFTASVASRTRSGDSTISAVAKGSEPSELNASRIAAARRVVSMFALT